MSTAASACTVYCLLALIVLPAGPGRETGESSQTAAEASLMPTEALHLLNVALATGDRSKQGEIARPILARAKKADLSPEEEIALGELYFLALNGKDSDAIFTKFLTRTDRIGRMAWIRHQQVQFRAFDKHAETELATAAFRQQFPVSPDDLTYTSSMTGNQAGRYAAEGNHAKVVELILEDLKGLPQDQPMRSFRLLGPYYVSFARLGRAAEAKGILEAHRAKLQDRVAKAGATVVAASTLKAQSVPHRVGQLHADWDTGNADDDPAFDRDRFNTQVAIDAVQALDTILARIAAGK